jgi:glycosyltransferase involved in cell wall biosynthesis
MPAAMKVSVVTISFNQGAYLEAAIRSVVEQDYRDIEYIVVDPGSTDGSRDIIERYRSHFAAVILYPDDGPARGLNNGLARASGEVLTYVNADDALLPGAIGRAVAAFRKHSEADVIYGHGYLVDERGLILRRLRSAPFNLRRALYDASVIVQQATFFRRHAFLEIGGFNPDNRSCWDYELIVDLALAGKRFQRVDQYWGLFRMHPQSITGSGRFATQILREDARIFRKATGHSRGRFFWLAHGVARLEKWLVDPKSFLISVSDFVCGKRNRQGP